ncbi:Uncharacterised protein [Mycobacteroides abscessus subsp. abscessus]|nr:Uncharacterised protein [Mycobacteroides abscessus subsp. abscessus]
MAALTKRAGRESLWTAMRSAMRTGVVAAAGSNIQHLP